MGWCSIITNSITLTSLYSFFSHVYNVSNVKEWLHGTASSSLSKSIMPTHSTTEYFCEATVSWSACYPISDDSLKRNLKWNASDYCIKHIIWIQMFWILKGIFLIYKNVLKKHNSNLVKNHIQEVRVNLMCVFFSQYECGLSYYH